MEIYNPFQSYKAGNRVKYQHSVGGIIGVQEYILQAKADLTPGAGVNGFNWKNLSPRTYSVTTEVQANVLSLLWFDKVIRTNNNSVWINTSPNIGDNTTEFSITRSKGSVLKQRVSLVDDGSSNYYEFDAVFATLREEGYAGESHRSQREYFSYFSETDLILDLININPGTTMVITVTAEDIKTPWGTDASSLLRLYFDTSTLEIDANSNSFNVSGHTWNMTSKLGDYLREGEAAKLVISNRNGKIFANLLPKKF